MSTIAAPLEMQGAYVPPQRVTIASVYPEEMSVYISRRAPKQNFVVPAGTREKPGILVVEDTWETGSTSTPTHVRILAEHTANHIVSDLTEHIWGIEPISRAWPGIFRCAGDSPTKAEIDAAWEGQNRYWDHLIQQARSIERDQLAGIKSGARISVKHLLAAKIRGVEGETWITNTTENKKKCSWCATWIDSSARKCGSCGEFQSAADAEAAARVKQAAEPKPVDPPMKPQTQAAQTASK